MPTELSIGELARRAGVRTSTLRYYEKQDLLAPSARTHAGYRVYGPEAEETLRFIQRAQRIGFSLDDIRSLLDTTAPTSDATVLAAAEERFVALERRLTELLVTRHELERFLLDLSGRLRDPNAAAAADAPNHDVYERLITRVCGHDEGSPGGTDDADVAGLTLDWLLERTGCRLADIDVVDVVEALQGVHVHVWQQGDGYSIVVRSRDPEVERALRELARVEAVCHAHPRPTLSEESDGFLFVASGDDAFLFVQFFLSLEER